MIRAPGIVHGLDIDLYHGGDGISKSGLDLIARSPQTFYKLRRAADRPAPTIKAGQLEGALCHCAVLEPDHFKDRYAVGPDVSRATKEWKFFEASVAPGVLAIKPDQYSVAWWQADSVRELPDVAEILAGGRSEVSAFWTDSVTGELCKVRPDWVHPVGNNTAVLMDLKTYSDASPSEFKRQIARKRYHVQDALYSDGYATAAKEKVLGFVFVAVESAYPFMATPIMLDERSREEGRRLYRRDLDTYARCVKTDTWPGYSSGIETVSLPHYAFETEEA